MKANEYPDALYRKLWFSPTERHVECAEAYERHKRANGLMDFDDCLLWAYDALRAGIVAGYSWVQVDEVQDLTPLQLAIVRMLARRRMLHCCISVMSGRQYSNLSGLVRRRFLLSKGYAQGA